MTRPIALLLLFTVHSLSMEMRETVERMVMVRTTGSDLQPAATGFIYKQENDGEASVIRMGESEVMEHLAKMYEQPKAYAAPIPVAAGPFYAKEEDGKAASDRQDRVIPVKEEIDGIVEDDFKKILKEYKTKLDDPHSFDDYLHNVGDYDGVYHKYGDDDDKEYKGYKVNKHYNNGDIGDYHTAKFESYKIAGGHQKGHGDANAYGKHFKDINNEKVGYYGYKSNHDGDKQQKADGFQKYDNEDKKNIYGDESNRDDGYHKFASSNYDASDDGGYKAGSLQPKHRGADFRKSGEHVDKSGEEDTNRSFESDEDSSHDGRGQFGSDGGKNNGKSYGFKIKH